MNTLARVFVVLVSIPLAVACGSGGGESSGADPGTDPGTDVALDVPSDLPGDALTDLPPDLPPDVLPDAPTDLPADTPESPAALSVTVLTLSGAPLAAATVVLGERTLTTDAEGVARFDNVGAGHLVARVTKAGYAPSTAVADLGAGLDAKASVFLLSLGSPITFSAEDGASLVQGRVRVQIPPGALVTADGTPVTGNAELTIAGLDPTSSDVVAAPGPFVGLAAGGTDPVNLKSVYLAEISLEAGGQPVKLAVGKKATLEFALPESLQAAYEPGDTIAAWWYDLEAGLWRQEGEGTIEAGSAPGAPKVWSAQVGHFTWWNADLAYTEDNCVQVTVVRSEGAVPIPGLQVRAEGTYGSSGGITDDQGQVCLEFAKGETSTVYVDVGAGHQGASAVVEGWPGSGGCDGVGEPCKPVTLTLQACADATECADADPCTTDACDQDQLGVGVCLYAAEACDDGNPCTDDSCNAEGQCRNVNRCDDDDPCTTDHCLPEGCLYVPPLEGLCDPALGCVTADDCEDGQPCTLTDCVAGACTVTAIEAPCLEPCTTDAACATDLACADGLCLPFVGCYLAPKTCNDGDQCTLDACNEPGGCTHTAIAGCQCTAHDHQDCCGVDICWFDACGEQEEVATACTGGATCELALGGPICKACVPVCPADWCGADACGGTCACSGNKVCDPATHQCEAPCVKQCGARECGPDPVCGQSCGECVGVEPVCNLETGQCQAGCVAQDHKGCCTYSAPILPIAPASFSPLALGAKNAICWFDSCGVQDPGPVVEACGFATPQCLAKTPPECGTCTYDCGGLDPGNPHGKCGVDDGCFGTCECPAGQMCNDATHFCYSCSCAGKACGADDGCGTKCLGTCPAGQVCKASTFTCCTPVCAGKACGADDGCGGTCAGSCPGGQVCSAGHVCEAFETPCATALDCVIACGAVTSACAQGCFQQVSGNADASAKLQALAGCALGVCGMAGTIECLLGTTQTTCKTQYDACTTCTPNCAGKECGDDGCAGTCAPGCTGPDVCQSGQCCTPTPCGAKQCGTDGCGTSCGSCAAGTACNTSTWMCEAVNGCAGAACGASDGTDAGTCYGWCSNAAQQCVNKTCQSCGCYGTPTCCDGGTAICHTCEGCGGSMKLPCSRGCTETEQGPKCLDCTNKQCGDDGSGNSNACGTCGEFQFCAFGAYCQDPA